MEKIDNKELINQCVKNKRSAQKYLYEQYFDAMFSIGRRYTNDDDKIIEWVNNGFLKVFKKMNTVRNPDALPGWIKSVVYRSILDGIRSERRYWESVVFEIDYRMEADNKIVLDHDYELIKAEIQSLPDSSKQVFELFVFEGFSHKDIAKKVGISEGTSKWHLSNARSKLQEILVEKKLIGFG